MLAVLTTQVKQKLNITWDDEDTNARVEHIINTAIPDLTHRLGITDSNFDFSVPGAENALFLAYCLYEWNHSLNEFADNYARMIANVRAVHEVKNYKKSEGADDEA